MMLTVQQHSLVMPCIARGPSTPAKRSGVANIDVLVNFGMALPKPRFKVIAFRVTLGVVKQTVDCSLKPLTSPLD